MAVVPYSERRKKRLEEEEKSSSQSKKTSSVTSYSERRKKEQFEKSGGVNSLLSDLQSTNDVINSVYGGWQDAETMSANKDKITSTYDRLNDYKAIMGEYKGNNDFNSNIDKYLEAYSSAMKDMDIFSDDYGYYQNADAYHQAQKEYEKEQKKASYTSLADYDAEIENLRRTMSGDPTKAKNYLDQLNEVTQWRADYLKENPSAKYEHLDTNEDFEAESQYKGANYDGLWDRLTNKEKDVYEIVNQIHSQETDDAKRMMAGNGQMAGFLGSAPEGIVEMTPEEVSRYFYISNTQGMEKGLEYLEDLEISLTKRAHDRSIQKETEWLESGNGVTRKLKQGVMSAMTVPVGIVANLEGVADDITDLVTGNEMNPYDSAHSRMNSVQNVRGTTRENIAEYTTEHNWVGTDLPIIGNAYTFAYDTGLSMAESALGANAFGSNFSKIMGFTSAGLKAQELKEAGEGTAEIVAGATMAGLAEWFFERYSIEGLISLKSADSIKAVAKNFAKQALTEGSEEMFTEFANSVSDLLIRGQDSDAVKSFNEYRRRGFSEEEAWSKVNKEVATQIASAGIGGMVSGSVMGGAGSALEYNANVNTGKEIANIGNVDRLQNLTESMGEGYETYAEKIKSGTATNAEMGSAYRQAEAQLREETAIGRKDISAETASKYRQYESVMTEKTEVEKNAKARASEIKQGEKTVDNQSGTEITIEGMSKVNGETVLETSEGQRKLSDVTMTSRQAMAVAYAEMMDDSVADTFVSYYDGKSDINAYKDNFDLILAYGEKAYGADNAVKMKGALSTEQAIAVYNIGMNNATSAEQAKLEKITADHLAKNPTFVAGTFDDSAINYDTLTATQKKKVALMRMVSERFGMNIVLQQSSVVNGEANLDYNGKYRESENTIYVDVNAGLPNLESAEAIIPTLSHEMTHWMKHKAREAYANLSSVVMDALVEKSGLSVEELIHAEQERFKKTHKGETIDEEGAQDELIARACEDMFANSKVAQEYLSKMDENTAKTFVEKLKETIENLKKWIADILSECKSKSPEARLLRAYAEKLDSAQEIWDTALMKSIETNQALMAEGINGLELINGISKDGTTIVGENAIQMSERTYRDGGKEYLMNWLDNQVNEGKISKKDADSIIEQTDIMYELMQDIKNNNELPDYARWAETDVTLNEEGEKVSVIVKNGDYSMNLDVSQVCKKRTALNAVLNAMVKSKDLSLYTLTETDVATLNDIIKRHDFEIACALCFVDSKRYRVGSWAETFCEGETKKEKKVNVHKYGFNEMVRSLVPKGSDIKIDEFNFTGRNILNQPTENLLKDMDDSKLDFSLIDKIMAENDPKTAQHRYAKAIKENKNLRSILNPSEIISSIGLDAIRVENMSLYKLINGHQGTAKPKFAHDVVAFKNDILKATSWTADKAKYVGGVRLQSFSDFMANMVFDYVQMISELSARQLTAHAYTKEPLFVALFGQTGMKVNMSLVPRVALTDEELARFRKMSKKKREADPEFKKIKETAGLYIDENGETRYAWEDETFDFDVAMDFMADPRYTPYCGTIAVGISNGHINKLLSDDKISMVIPYHKSSLNHIVAKMRNIDFYNDYTDVQNTRDKRTGKKLEKGVADFNFYEDLYGVMDSDGSVIKEGTHDPKQTAENYKKWCEEKGYIPKFDQFAKHPNYYKLLVDFSVYDINNNMAYTEHQPVKPIYPSKEEFTNLILKGVVKNGVTYGGLEQSQDTSDRLKKETNTIIKEFKNELTKKYGKDVLGTHEQYASRNVEPLTDDDYKSMEKHFGTTGNFNVAGYMLPSGKILDFSGKHWGDTTSRMRQVDHRDISEVVPDDHNGFEAMVRMISNGNIRLMPETGGINLAVAPTKNQRTVLRRYIEYFKGECVVDFDAIGGDTVESFSYEKGTSADRIMKDIDNYFKGGRQSELMRFHEQYSDRVTDPEMLDYLNEQIENGEYATVYRSFQIIDGGLYAPMNAVDRDENGKNKRLGYRSELGQWEMATESPEIAQRYMDAHPEAPYAKFDLDGVDNKTGGVAYNPYLHASNLVLNDQFSGAYRRNLVTVECRVPLSEIGAYRAKYAKDATGWADWKAGTVAGKLMKVKPELTRKLFISRYMLPVRIVPDSEVAQMYKDYLSGTDIPVPWNVVTASLREELEKAGVKVAYNDVKFGTKVVKFNDVFETKYADRNTESVYDVMGEVDRLKSENAKLAEDIERLNEVNRIEQNYIKKKSLSTSHVKAIAERLLKKANSTQDVKVLTESLKDVYEYLHNDNIDWNVFLMKATDIGRSILDDSKVKNPKKYADIEGYSEEELAEANIFLNDYVREEKARSIAFEIYNQFWNMSEKKDNDKVKKLKAKHREEMAEMKDQYEKPIEDVQYVKEHYQIMLKNLRIKKNIQLDNLEEKINTGRKIDQVKRKANSLYTKLNDNSKNKHIPQPLKPIVLEVLMAIDYSSKTMLDRNKETKYDVEMRKSFEKLQKMAEEIIKEPNKYGMYVDFPPTFVEEVGQIIKGIQDQIDDTVTGTFVLNRMTYKELDTLDKLLSELSYAVTTIDRKLGDVNKGRVSDDGDSSLQYMESLGKKSQYLNVFTDIANFSMILPINAFKKFGRGGENIFRGLQDGFDQFARNVKTIKDFAKGTKDTEGAWKAKEAREWRKEVHDIKLTRHGETKTYQMTTAQIMSLYCLSKREQARENHIYKKGIRITDFSVEKGKTISQTEDIQLSEKELNNILSILDKNPRAKEVADKIQEFMNTVCSDWGNAISMQRFGILQFGEENYFPIKVTSDSLDQQTYDSDTSLYRLLNMSFTKAVNENAENAIEVGDIFSTFASHSADMAKYNAMALPVLDTIKWLNYRQKGAITENKTESLEDKGVMKSMYNAYGKGAENYVKDLLKAVNGATDASLNPMQKIVRKMVRNAKVSAVMANLNVILLQPTAYFRASAVLDWKYMAKGFAHLPQMEKAKEFCGMALWKDMGHYDLNLSRGLEKEIMNDNTVVETLVDFSGKGAGLADSITWGFLWNACEAEVRDKNPNLSGDELNKAVGERLRDIIYSTQVVDSPLTRTQAMRDKDGLTQLVTAFMSEPMVSYNVLYSAYDQWHRDARKYGKQYAFKNNGKKFLRALFAYGVTSLAGAIVRQAMDYFRDDDDEEKSVEDFMKNVGINMLEDFVGIFPIAKDMVSIWQGYSPSRLDEQFMTSLYYTYKAWTDKELNYKDFQSFAKAVSQMSGLPISNAEREIRTIWNNVMKLIGYDSLKLK